jgi:MerR family transcriptional regulator, light-induced transcriptional regulator
MGEAAALLSVSPGALLAWEERFGFPRSTGSGTGGRLYALGEVVALRNGLKSELSVAPAIERARDASGTDGRA